MRPTDQPVEWDSLNAKILKDFLLSSTGERAIGSILFDMPPFETDDAHATLVSSCLREGYQRAINNLLALTTRQPEQPEPAINANYPDIDDDSKWKDTEPLGVTGVVGENKKPTA